MSSRPITEADIQRAVGLASLLEVIAHASRNIENMGDAEQTNMANSIGTALDLAADLASDLCVLMERNKVKEEAHNG